MPMTALLGHEARYLKAQAKAIHGRHARNRSPWEAKHYESEGCRHFMTSPVRRAGRFAQARDSYTREAWSPYEKLPQRFMPARRIT
jgi:hypothetical protein